jgi:hypothetical protein
MGSGGSPIMRIIMQDTNQSRILELSRLISYDIHSFIEDEVCERYGAYGDEVFFDALEISLDALSKALKETRDEEEK